MKTKIFIISVIAFLAVSCQKELTDFENPSNEGLVITASVEQPGDATKTSLDGFSVKWTKDDQIYLTDGTNWAIYKADATAASTTFTKVPDVGVGTLSDGTVYAYYPAENVTGFSSGTFTANIPAVQPYCATGFSNGVNPMTAKGTITSGTVALEFKNVMAFVKVQISDSGTGKTLNSLSLTSSTANLSGTATIAVGNDGKPASTTISGSKSVLLNGISSALTSTATPAYIAVPAASLGTLTLIAITNESDGIYYQTKTSSNPLEPARSSINSYNGLGIGSFTGKTKIIPDAAANCYMVDASSQSLLKLPLSQAIAGWDAIKALETSDTFDKTKITSDSPAARSIAVRWLDGTSGSISLIDIDETNMTLAMTGCSNGSNAVVDLMNGTEIVWSWHIWFTDYKPGEDQVHTTGGQVHSYENAAFSSGGKYFGKVIMDRNLGATITGVSGVMSRPSAEDAPKYYGLYYQFGRKDPFPARDAEIISGKRSNSYAVNNPSIFITSTTIEIGWSTDASNTDPWNALLTDKSALDPCPAGWRNPINNTLDKNNVWSGLDMSKFKSVKNYATGALWEFVSGKFTWIPTSGFIRYSDGVFVLGETYAFYWGSESFNKEKGYLFQGGTDYSETSNVTRVYGLSIRCVKD